QYEARRGRGYIGTGWIVKRSFGILTIKFISDRISYLKTENLAIYGVYLSCNNNNLESRIEINSVIENEARRGRRYGGTGWIWNNGDHWALTTEIDLEKEKNTPEVNKNRTKSCVPNDFTGYISKIIWNSLTKNIYKENLEASLNKIYLNNVSKYVDNKKTLSQKLNGYLKRLRSL
ncbi:unnamed protein product, partial [Brachionus calyciflorus]